MDIFEQVRHDPYKAMQRLGLHRHPLTVEVMRSSERKHLKQDLRRVCQCILYADDAHTQFQRMKAVRAKRQ
eukprot:282502-Alexandrium_andersonii.AAC.1